jgi:hypothetical protein
MMLPFVFILIIIAITSNNGIKNIIKKKENKKSKHLFKNL